MITSQLDIIPDPVKYVFVSELPDVGQRDTIYVCYVFGLVNKKKTLIGLGYYVFLNGGWDLIYVDQYLKGSEEDFWVAVSALKEEKE